MRGWGRSMLLRWRRSSLRPVIESSATPLVCLCLAAVVAGAIVIGQLPPAPKASVPTPLRHWPDLWAVPLEVGSVAPDFTLPETNGHRHIRLASFRGRTPVVLLFGSFT